MAIKNLVAARVVDSIMIAPEYKKNYPEAASQSFKKGQFVKLSSGKVAVCTSADTETIGMATHDASGVEDTRVLVALALPGTVFEVNVYHGTAGSAVTAITQIGVNYPLVVGSNKCHADIENTTNDFFTVIALSPIDAVGDRYGRVYVQVLPTVSKVATGA